jgi:hypothetical protein
MLEVEPLALRCAQVGRRHVRQPKVTPVLSKVGMIETGSGPAGVTEGCSSKGCAGKVCAALTAVLSGR